jgi:hypothetical protein
VIPVKKKNLADNKRKASRDEKEISIIMKKRYALLLTGLLTLSLAAGISILSSVSKISGIRFYRPHKLSW